MEFRKGRWRYRILADQAESWESELRQLRPVLVDDRNPGRKKPLLTFGRHIFLFLNPDVEHLILEHNTLFLTDDYYHAVVNLQYDYRTIGHGHCLVDISEQSIYLLSCNLWACSNRHNVCALVIPPPYHPRCSRCGASMRLCRDPVYPDIRHRLKEMEALSYAKKAMDTISYQASGVASVESQA
ncbi:MAG: hypothetical protein ABIN58_06330 [candidate division WOR-3 bacterium]